MDLLPNDIVRRIGNRLERNDLGSAVKASRSMRSVLGPEIDRRERAQVLGVLERAQRETEPINVVLSSDAYYYSFVLSFSGSTGTIKFGKNKRYHWVPRLETCTFMDDGHRSLSMADARAIAKEVLRDVFSGRARDACIRLTSSGDPAFVAATVMTYAYDIFMRSST